MKVIILDNNDNLENENVIRKSLENEDVALIINDSTMPICDKNTMDKYSAEKLLENIIISARYNVESLTYEDKRYNNEKKISQQGWKNRNKFKR